MTVELPNWFLCLGGIAMIVWIFAGVQAWKASKAIRDSVGEPRGRFIRFGMPPQPPQNPYDDADWWKKG